MPVKDTLISLIIRDFNLDKENQALHKYEC